MDKEGIKTSIFISYARIDAPRIDSLVKELAGDDVSVFWDMNSIQAGESFQESITEAIENSSAMICFISLAYTRSVWCKSEVEYALTHKIPVIPVLLDNSKVEAPLSYFNSLDLKDINSEKDIKIAGSRLKQSIFALVEKNIQDCSEASKNGDM